MESPLVGDSIYVMSLQRQTLGTGLSQVLVRRELTVSRYQETLAPWECDALIVTSLTIHLSNSSNRVFKNRILLSSTYISINTFMAWTKQNKNRKKGNVFLFGQCISWRCITLGPRKESHLDGDNFFMVCRKETSRCSVLCEKITA